MIPHVRCAGSSGRTLSTFTAVELIDGFSKNWRFSREDAIMNAAGTGIAMLLERNPPLDRLLDLRVLYRPSPEGGRNFEPFGDYSGQTYLLVAKASGIPALHDHPLLRYVELAVGYRARGYENAVSSGRDDRSRLLYFGVSLNLSELPGEILFKHAAAQQRTQRVTETILEFVQIPGTTALISHRLAAD